MVNMLPITAILTMVGGIFAINNSMPTPKRGKSGKVARGSVLLIEGLDRLPRKKSAPFFLSLARWHRDSCAARRPGVREGPMRLESLVLSVVSLALAHEESAKKSERLSEVWQRKKRSTPPETAVTARMPSW